MSADSFNFELSTPITYAGGDGNAIQAQFITLNPPTPKQLHLTSQLKQAWFRSFPKNQGDDSGSNKDDANALDNLDGDAIMTMISMSSDVELSVVLQLGMELFCQKGIALIDGETPMNRPLIEQLAADDIESMLGEYLINFILASALKKMKKLLEA